MLGGLHARHSVEGVPVDLDVGGIARPDKFGSVRGPVHAVCVSRQAFLADKGHRSAGRCLPKPSWDKHTSFAQGHEVATLAYAQREASFLSNVINRIPSLEQRCGVLDIWQDRNLDRFDNIGREPVRDSEKSKNIVKPERIARTHIEEFKRETRDWNGGLWDDANIMYCSVLRTSGGGAYTLARTRRLGPVVHVGAAGCRAVKILWGSHVPYAQPKVKNETGIKDCTLLLFTMPFNEEQFRVSVETGGTDTVCNLGLPLSVNYIGNAFILDPYSLPDPETPMIDFRIAKLFANMYIQAPAGPAEARYAVRQYLDKNLYMTDRILTAFINTGIPEEDWHVIARCIVVFHEVMASVAKPQESFWYRETTQSNGVEKYTWKNVIVGDDGAPPPYVYGIDALKAKRRAVGLPSSNRTMRSCVKAVMHWTTYDRQHRAHEETAFRFGVDSPFFEELMNVSWHPRRHLNNGEKDM